MGKNVRKDEIQARLQLDGKQAINELGRLKTESQGLARENRTLQKEFDKLDKKLASAKAKDQKDKVKELSGAMSELSGRMKANSEQIDRNAAAYDAIIQKEGLSIQTTKQLRNYRGQLVNQLEKELIPGTEEYTKKLKELHEVDGALAKRKADMKAPVAPSNPFSLSAIGAQIPAAIAGGIGGAVVAMASQMIGDMINGISGKIEKLAEKSDAMTDLALAFNKTNEEAKQLSDSVGKIDNRLGSKVMRDIATEAGKLDVPLEEVRSFTEAMGETALAMQSDFKGGVDVMTQDFTKLKGLFSDTKELAYADSIRKMGSAMKSLADTGTATATFQVDFLKRVGQLPETLRPGIKELMGLAAVTEEAGMTSEIAASGIADILSTAGAKSGGFAKLFGLSKKAFEEFLNTRPNEFLLQLAEKLRAMSGTQAAQTLANLGMTSGETLKVMGTLANNIEKVRDKQEAASEAFDKGTRLTEIFAQKNDNLAGRIERAGNVISRWMNNSFLGSALEKISGDIANAILAIDKSARTMENANAAYDIQAKKVKTLESEIAPLLVRYDQLKTKSVLTKDEQAELTTTIGKVGEAIPIAISRFGDYGKALDINTAKARKFIEQEQAYLQYLNKDRLTIVNDDLNKAREEFGKAHKALLNRDAQGNIQVYETTMALGMQGSKTRLRKATNEEILKMQKDFEAAQTRLMAIKRNRNELAGLKEPDKPKAKDKEDPIIPSTFDPNSLKPDKKGKSDADKLREEQMQNSIETAKKLAQMAIDEIKDEETRKIRQLENDFQQELASQKRLVEEKKMLEGDFQSWKSGAEKHLQFEISEVEAAAEKKREETAKKAALKVSEAVLREAKAAAEEKVIIAKGELDVATTMEEKAAAQQSMYEYELAVLAAEEDLALLTATEEQKAAIKREFLNRQRELENKHFEAIGRIQKKDLSATKKTEQEKAQIREATGQLVGQIAGAVFEISAAYRQRELQAVDAEKDKKIAALDDQLSRNLISQDQYNVQRDAIERQAEAKRKALQKKQAEADKMNAIFQATMNLSLAVTKAFAQGGGIGGPILAGIAAAAAGVQLAKIIATPIPEFAQGGFTDVDVKKNPAGFTGRKPMLSIMGESGREYVVNNSMLQNPWVQNAVGIMESFRTRGMASSGYTPTQQAAPGGGAQPMIIPPPDTSERDAMMIQMLSRLNDNLEGGIGVNYMSLEKTIRKMENLKARAKTSSVSI